jgi:hypothetical protein
VKTCRNFLIKHALRASLLLGLRSGIPPVTVFSLESGKLCEPKLCKKKVGKHRYYTEANGEAYFGKVGDVPFETAKDHFREHLGRKQALEPVDALTVGKLFSTFLTWVKANRSDPTYRRRKSDCSRFGRFVCGGQHLADSTWTSSAVGGSRSTGETGCGHARTLSWT